MSNCTLCQTTGDQLLWENDLFRIIDAQDPQYPGFTRVIWNAHVAEMTDLLPADQLMLMQNVLKIEMIQRDILQPDKINLAAFGNMVPHLHWHIIPRWRDDAHFPQPVWAARPHADDYALARQALRLEAIQARIPAYHAAIRSKMPS